MRVCPVCGETNEDWMDICQRCGNSLTVNKDDELPYDYTKSQSNYDQYINDTRGYNYNNNNNNNANYNTNEYYDYGGNNYDINYDNSYDMNSTADT